MIIKSIIKSKPVENLLVSTFFKRRCSKKSGLKMAKIESAEFKSILTPEMSVLSQLFLNHGFELRIAGGAVRLRQLSFAFFQEKSASAHYADGVSIPVFELVGKMLEEVFFQKIRGTM